MPPSSSERSIGFHTVAIAVVGWMCLGILGWSVFDAAELAGSSEVGFIDAWRAAIGAGFKVTIAALPLGIVAGWWWHRSRSGQRIRQFFRSHPLPCAAGIVSTAVGAVMLSYIVFGALELYRDLFASETVHQLALSISIPLAALAIAGLTALLFSFLKRRLQRIDSTGPVVAISLLSVIALLSAWGVSLTRLGAEVWQQLSVHSFLAPLAIGFFAVSGAVLAHHQTPRRALAALAVIMIPFGVIQLFDTPSQDLRLAMAYGNSGTGFVEKLFDESTDHSFHSEESNRGQSAVCDPGVDPPRLGDVGTAGDEAPDIIWVTVDALRFDHTSMDDYRRDTTPHLARYGADAALFERAYTPASSTRQTFASLFTGVYPSMLDNPPGPTWGLTLSPNQHTIAEFLGRAGYRNMALSSEDNIFSAHHGGLDGFDVVDEAPVDDKINLGYSAPGKIDTIIDELDSSTSPRFIWSHLIEPHQPYRTGPDPIEFGDDDVDRFDAAIHFVDDELRRLLAFVDERQAQRPTYLILTADHGHAFGEHQNRYHGTTVYREEVHVPLMIWGPDIEGQRHDTPISVLDIFSTTLELAGLDVPEGMCSQSLADDLRAGRAPEPRPVYIEQVPDDSRPYFSVGFIDDSHSLVLDPSIEAVSVFDLDGDPRQQRDLSADDPQLVEERLEELREFWQQRGMQPSDYGQ